MQCIHHLGYRGQGEKQLIFLQPRETHLLSHESGHRVASSDCKPAHGPRVRWQGNQSVTMPKQTLSYLPCRESFSGSSVRRTRCGTPKLSHFPSHFMKTQRVKFLLPSRYVLPGEIKKCRHHNVKTCVHFIVLGKLHINHNSRTVTSYLFSHLAHHDVLTRNSCMSCFLQPIQYYTLPHTSAAFLSALKLSLAVRCHSSCLFRGLNPA